MTNQPNTTDSQEALKPRKRGDGSIYQRGKTWWIRFWFRGKEYRESSESADYIKAEKFLDRRLKEMGGDREGLRTFAPKAEKIYIDEILDALEREYKRGGGRGLPQFRSHLKPVREAFGDVRAVDLRTKRVEAYIERRQDVGKAEATINREVEVLRRAFNLAIERGELVAAPHFPRLAEDNVRQGFFERHELEAVVNELPEYLQDFTRFGYLTAWRKGQIAKLTWADVDRGGRTIQAQAKNVKNGKPHKIALEGELAKIIERRWATREYMTEQGNPAIATHVFHRDGYKIGDVRKSWATACEKAGLVKPKLDKDGEPVAKKNEEGEEITVMVPSRHFHDLRRSGVRNMVRAGVREDVAMKISGHKTRSMFSRYNIVDDTDIREAILQTQQYVDAQPAQGKVVAIAARAK